MRARLALSIAAALTGAAHGEPGAGHGEPGAGHGEPGDGGADSAHALLDGAPTCDPERAHCFAIRLHVVDDGGLVASRPWLAAELAGANRRFAPLGVGWQVASIDELPADFAHVAGRAQRDEIAEGRLGAGALDVFVVGALDDLDGPGTIYGVTWHRPRDDRKYAIVSTEALERTLAHELGHVFGLPHSTYVSIMNPSLPPLAERMFADEEIAAMRARLPRLVRSAVLVEVRE